MSNYWKLNPKERFHFFKDISADEKNEIINKLLKSCPEVNWPYGMPLSLCADLIFVGASPGSSGTDYKVDSWSCTSCNICTVSCPSDSIKLKVQRDR